MRAVVQRVARARVLVEGDVVGAIERGLAILIGIERGDQSAELDGLAERIVQARVFADDAGRTNLSLLEVGGSVLVVSQFTLCADLTKGRRPSFDAAEEPGRARILVEHFVAALRRLGCVVAEGRFGAHMSVEFVNDGPVTLIYERPARAPRSSTP